MQLSLWHLQRGNRPTSHDLRLPCDTPFLHLGFMFAKLVAGCSFCAACVPVFLFISINFGVSGFVKQAETARGCKTF